MNKPQFGTLLLTTFILWALGYALRGLLIAEVAALLRDSIRESDSEFRPMGRECDLARKYLRIIGVRFGERFKPCMYVPESLQAQPVPRALLPTLTNSGPGMGRTPLPGETDVANRACTRAVRILGLTSKHGFTGQ